MRLVLGVAGSVVLVAGVVVGGMGSGRFDPILSERDTPMTVSAALRRNRQLPLSETQALVAAHAARAVGDQAAEVELLERAMAGGPLAEVARIELAEAVAEADGERAVALVLQTLESPGTPQLREAALEVALLVLRSGVMPVTRLKLEKIVPRLPRSSRGRLQVGLADPKDNSWRRVLGRMLKLNRVDLAAFEAAHILNELPDLTPRERWYVARCFYQHALYEVAAPKLQALVEGKGRGVPIWEASFLRGRCAFRGDQWSEAVTWYRRALTAVPNREREAELRVHLARALELGGDLGQAVEQARLAVLADTTDSRRLFLARLRLRSGRVDLAEAGIARIRLRSERSRGRLLVALHFFAMAQVDVGLEALNRVSSRPWRGPAHVLAATVLAEAGQFDQALQRLERAAPELDIFWGGLARETMGDLPGELVGKWREQQRSAVVEGGAASRRALRKWSVLEWDPRELSKVRKAVAKSRPLDVSMEEPVVTGLAGLLWQHGLRAGAVRWDPNAFPVGTPEEALWTARTFSAEEMPWRAIRAADTSWRSRGADVPLRAYPEVLEIASYPLPHLQRVREVATAADIDWTVVAGVAREESRWNPGVLSRVGARGLMQLMPATAADVATSIGFAVPLQEDLFDPGLSLQLGSKELGRLVAAFDGFIAPAVAAYNAGEAQSRQWLDQCGKGCDTARFLLTMTFGATRTYTADVLAAAEVYGRRIKGRSERPHVVPESAPPNVRSPD
ncbi:MAG: lytic transglycosylase domain-containing protein [Thermoanaerobaculales bacterium]|nr:lytic transglycosylase domain-containing protein [Thermoanaerobaculales bacterium]